MKRIAMVGYFGWGNFGDELFLETHRQWLGSKYDLFVANDLLKEPYFSVPAEEVAADADAILIGGGDLLNPMRVSGLYWQKAWLKKPTFVFGLGVPRQPFRRANVLNQYESFLSDPNCKLVSARDQESYQWLKENFNLGEKLVWYPDPVCSLARPQKLESSDKVLGVVMREHRSLKEDFSPLRKMIDTAKEKDYRIRHLVLANQQLGKADRQRAESLAQEDEEVVSSEDLRELCQEISRCSLLATIKFHGLVVATMYGVPSIAMSVTPKNQNFLKMIERPEMLCSYTDPNLYKRVSWYPSTVHQKVRGSLYRESANGYRRIIEELERVFS